MATRPTARGRLVDGEIGGHRIVWFPDAALLAAEGHPGGEGTLALADDLPGAYSALQGALEASMEAELPGDRRFSWSEHGAVGVRRLDTAVNLSWEGDQREGLALLAGLNSVPMGQLQTRSIRQPGGSAIETVSWHARSGGKLARAYDWGLHHQAAGRGQDVRMEDQRRWSGESRRELDELTNAYMRDTHQRRFLPLWRATKGLRVVTSTNLAKQLRRAVVEDRCTYGQAIDVAGHLLMEQAGVRIDQDTRLDEETGELVTVAHRSTRYRHARLARELGLVLVDGEVHEVEVDVEELMEAAFDPSAWDLRLDDVVDAERSS